MQKIRSDTRKLGELLEWKDSLVSISLLSIPLRYGEAIQRKITTMVQGQ